MKTPESIVVSAGGWLSLAAASLLLAGCLAAPSASSVRSKFDHQHPHGVIDRIVYVQRYSNGFKGGPVYVAYRIYYTEPPSPEMKMAERSFHQVAEGMYEDKPASLPSKKPSRL